MPPDDLGAAVDVTLPARRVVSLVPSLTESVASCRREALVGATQWCTSPGGLDVVRVRGPKNPDWRAIVDLRPDIVLANQEENREIDVRRLREAGVPVWVTVIESVAEALVSLERLFTCALGWDVPDWLGEAGRLWSSPRRGPVATTAIPIWRDPWMVVGRSTFPGDMVARLGLRNVFETHSERYPHVELADVDRSGVDVVLLPDEPYAFSADDGPEAFPTAPTLLVEGKLLTWYGPSMLRAYDELNRLFAPYRPAD